MVKSRKKKFSNGKNQTIDNYRVGRITENKINDKLFHNQERERERKQINIFAFSYHQMNLANGKTNKT